MKMKARLASGFTGAVLMLSAVQLSSFPAFAAEEDSFTQGKMAAHLGPDENTELDCRYYDSTPNIPFLKLSEFYDFVTDDPLTFISEEDGVFSFENYSGIKVTVNTVTDQLTSDNLDRLCTFEAKENEEMPFYIRTVNREYTQSPKTGTLDFSAYGIDLRADENDVWVPASTLCDCFLNDENQAAVIGKELYRFGINETEEYNSTVAATMALDTDTPRDADVIEYTYNELCFAVDNFYGFPGRIPLNSVLEEKGLDGMLESNEDAKSIKSYLRSADHSEYMVGLIGLGRYLFDGGHTVFDPNENFGELPDPIKKAIDDSMIYLTALEGASDVFGIVMNSGMNTEKIKEVRAEALGTSGPDESTPLTYVKKGDTAVFTFDAFLCDIPGWISFYEGTGERPDDLINAIYVALNDADQDPEIKNFLFDLSTNGGGTEAIVLYIMSLTADTDVISQYHRLAGTTLEQNILVDKNLDGKFDDADKNVKFDLNFGVLCTDISFSCGNYLPSLMKDAGFLVLGETSGGGSCIVDSRITADGIPYKLSSTIMLKNAKGENIDSGVEPHVSLVATDDDGVKDYSDLYNMEKISSEFAKFYGTEDSSTPEESKPEDTSPRTGAAAAGFAAVTILAAAIIAIRKKS